MIALTTLTFIFSMTKPLDKYPKKTITLVHELRDMKRNGIKLKNLAPEKIPFDLEKAKEDFRGIVNFVANYSPVYITQRTVLHLFKIITQFVYTQGY